MANYPDLTVETACEALRGAGQAYSPEEIRIIARDERWAVSRPGNRIAWFPASESGSRRLAVERRVLRLLADRCSFHAPRPLLVSDSGLDLRQMIPGRCDPRDLFQRCKVNSTLAQNIGRSVGAILAEQHTRIREADVFGWLPQRIVWPESGPWIRERLPQVVDDTDLIRKAGRLFERYDALTVDTKDHVLVHGDVGLHNLALDQQTDAVNGIFDYDSAAWTDRHHDFRYLLFDIGRKDMLNAALEVYEPAVGRAIDRDRLRLYNAACALCYLALRRGVPPNQRSCGRTLAEDVRWASAALSSLRV
jgi:hypothetical protein